MSLAVPARVIRKLAARWFPTRGQATFCLTVDEFQRRWDALVADAAVHGYDGVLGPIRARLESQWVRIWDEPDEAKRSQWVVRPVAREKPVAVRQALPAEKPVERGKKGVDGCVRCGRLLGRTTRHLCVRCTLAESASANNGEAGVVASSPTNEKPEVSQE